MKRTIYIINLFIISFLFPLSAQVEPVWDDVVKKMPKEELQEVNISSSIDGKIQKAYLYKAKSKKQQPLIVSLHTWSGDYRQNDPLVAEILARDWNYIHPNFRGANNNVEAMCSSKVLSDIEDAISFAIKQTNANPEEVHIIGVSGGGLATLFAYMNVDFDVKSFSAWVPISDIEAWYWESLGRNQKYANDIIKSLSKDSLFNKNEALLRSPLYQKFPKEKRKKSDLFLYSGIHDGYIGSVPITHSLNMFNRLVGELKYNTSDFEVISSKSKIDFDLISEKEIIDLVTKRMSPICSKNKPLFGRAVHFFRQYENIRLMIFEGGHEQLPQALSLIPYNNVTSLKYNILTIGDSNGQNKGGWVDQLQSMMPKSHIVNNSQSGRTIGFDNNGKKELNGLKNIDSFLDKAQKSIKNKQFDFIIISLGTNDAKNDFRDKQEDVSHNFELLLTKIKSHRLNKKSKTKLIFVTPPPMSNINIESKYEGGYTRLATLVPKLKQIARNKGFFVVDVHSPLQEVFNLYAPDGVHMISSGQKIIASQIVNLMLSDQINSD